MPDEFRTQVFERLFEAKGQATLIRAMLAKGMSAEQIAAATSLDVNAVLKYIR